jgi:hypothetical protein
MSRPTTAEVVDSEVQFPRRVGQADRDRAVAVTDGGVTLPAARALCIQAWGELVAVAVLADHNGEGESCVTPHPGHMWFPWAQRL